MRAASFDTYQQYCKARRASGYQVISRRLFNELKKEVRDESQVRD